TITYPLMGLLQKCATGKYERRNVFAIAESHDTAKEHGMVATERAKIIAANEVRRHVVKQRNPLRRQHVINTFKFVQCGAGELARNMSLVSAQHTDTKIQRATKGPMAGGCQVL